MEEIISSSWLWLCLLLLAAAMPQSSNSYNKYINRSYRILIINYLNKVKLIFDNIKTKVSTQRKNNNDEFGKLTSDNLLDDGGMSNQNNLFEQQETMPSDFTSYKGVINIYERAREINSLIEDSFVIRHQLYRN